MSKSNTPSSSALSRRKFLRAAGGITFAVSASAILPKWIMDGAEPALSTEDKGPAISAWVHIRPDGRITIYNPAAEMGQGSMTALPAIFAEELDADWSKVRIEFSPIEPKIYGPGAWGGRMMTVGSRAVSGYYESLRQAGAQARYVLMDNVAKKWNVPLAELSTEPSMVIHHASNRKITYGEIASFATMPEKLPQIPKEQLKDPKNFRLIGNPDIERCDMAAKVNGSAKYSIDVRIPGMVYGVISRSPVNGSKPTLTNAEEIRKISGVIDVVTLNHGIGVVADTLEKALKVKAQLKIQWSSDAKAASHSSQQAYAEYTSLVKDENRKGRSLEAKGDLNNALKDAPKVYSATYKNDYLYHAQMEPLNAVVALAPDGSSAEVWCGSQAPDSAKGAAARVLGLDESKVTLYPHFLGGGFGRRSSTDYVEEAAALAKAVRKPVKLLWTREDDLQYGQYRPICLQYLEAGVDQAGNINSWKYIISGTGDSLLASGAEMPFYTLPDLQIELRAVDHGMRTKHWRAVGHGPNKYAIEAFIDEIAYDQKKDPYQYRRQLMRNHPRALKVLETVAEMADWGKKLPAGRAMGIAFAERSGSPGAGVCEISLDRTTGKIKVHRIWAAVDGGVVVQPDNAKAQTEGSLLMGLSSVFYESITIKNGEAQQSNFHDYPLLRMEDVPEILEVKFVASNEPPSGLGEAGLPFIGPAVANAFLALTGKALRHMPFTPEKVLAVLASK
ncbi:MAG: xanthine dehydrogenase family protein molybdopterin-binding subunit [Haliscomenobacter sp.]|uniref:xanthine dehydrogenase family protein molybdopterin-binding subunit n=1 Tax=Haliscomenobacter sp. TaxID=2717303 RepID=UPI0029B0432C|nr:xanthine dehydrogenase family protein molybdopterin-binding subunit [Haliscomenobacter sp.]MDX2070393.1 xanthine dehydrogenase family protein molybdopterin-binding subunit [Haliscomenobacter sp.]